MKALMADKLVGTPGRALLVTGKFLSESMIQVDGQLFGSAWQVAPRDFPALNCPLVSHCNLADEKSETYVTLWPRNCLTHTHMELHSVSKFSHRVETELNLT